MFNSITASLKDINNLSSKYPIIPKSNFYDQTRQTREATTNDRDKGAGWLGDKSNSSAVEGHLKGIHETVKGIQKEVEAMRKDVISMNQNRNSSPTESGSESQSSKGRKNH